MASEKGAYGQSQKYENCDTFAIGLLICAMRTEVVCVHMTQLCPQYNHCYIIPMKRDFLQQFKIVCSL